MIDFSLESIKYQRKDPFHKDLTEIISGMYNAVKSKKFRTNRDLMESEYGTALNKLIKKRFNLTVEVDPILSDVVFMAIVPFSSDMINQVNKLGFNLPRKAAPFKFLNVIYKRVDEITKEAEQTAIKINNTRGEIDRNKAYVTGYLGDVRHHLLLNIFQCIHYKLTPAESAAAVIHEVGHAFTGLQNHYKQITTNASLSKVINQLNNNDIDKAKYVFKSEFGASEFEEAGISTSDTITDFYGNVAKMYLSQMESQYQSNYYDQTTFEYMSDEFVASMGAADHLASGLDKLMTLYTNGSNKVKFASVWTFIYTYLFFFIIGLCGPIGAVVATVLSVLAIYTSIQDAGTAPIYDNFRERHARSARNIINILKDRSLNKQEVTLLIKQYEAVTEIVELNNDFTTLGNSFWSSFMPTIRKGKYYRQRQQKIENLLNSPLFVKAAKLNTIGE